MTPQELPPREESPAPGTGPIPAWRRGLPAGILLLHVVAIGFAGYAYSRRESAKEIRASEKELEFIAEAKARQVAEWYEERLDDARDFLSPVHQRALRTALADPASPAMRELTRSLEAFRSDRLYRSITVFDERGTPRILDPPPAPGTPPPVGRDPAFISALAPGQIRVDDIHRLPGDRERLAIDLWVPIGGDDGEKASRGALRLEIEPRDYLLPLLRRWPVPSETAESLLVRREGNDVVFLNELRHGGSVELLGRRPILPQTSLPAALAAQGIEGTFAGIDYRNVPVFSAFRQIPGTPWALVAKVDRREALAPVRAQQRALAAGTSILILALVLGLGLVWRLRAERMLRRSEARYRALFGEVGDYALVLSFADPGNPVIVDANEAAFRYLGYSRQELVGRPLRILREAGDFEKYIAIVRERIRRPGDGCTLEANHLRRDGTPFPVEVTLRMFQLDDGLPLVLSVVRDRAEELRLREQLRLAREHELFERLVAGIAHEVRNPLHAIDACMVVFESQTPEADENRSMLRAVRKQVDRLAALMRDLIEIARPASQQRLERRRLVELCREGVRSPGAIGDAAAGIAIEGDERLEVDVEPAAFLQALANLVANAAHHSPVDGAIRIGIRREGDAAVVSVVDEGAGIPEELLPEVTKPFFTTRRGGTGLGLAVVERFASNHGGGFSIRNNAPERKGCTAEIRLPIPAAEESRVAGESGPS